MLFVDSNDVITVQLIDVNSTVLLQTIHGCCLGISFIEANRLAGDQGFNGDHVTYRSPASSSSDFPWPFSVSTRNTVTVALGFPSPETSSSLH